MNYTFLIDDTKIERLKKELCYVPTLPGVYLWKNSSGEVIYIGKAKSLRSRMRQYINLSDERAKIPLLVENIDSFEYIVVENENESLILEKNLIEQYKPFFNADLKDDSSYPYIAITAGDVIPSIKFTREKKKKGTLYFGPYTDSRAARNMVDLTRRIIPICSCKCTTWKKLQRGFEKSKKKHYSQNYELVTLDQKPCFDSSVGLSPGVCCGKCTLEDYRESVKRATSFLDGDRKDILNTLNTSMQQAAAELDFEKASRLKEKIKTIESLSTSQHISVKALDSADVIGFSREETICGVHVLILREGKIINKNEFVLNRGLDVPTSDLQHNFLLKYYEMTDNIPREIILRENYEEDDSITSWLTSRLNSSHGAKTKIVVPKKGEKFDLIKMAENNALHTLRRYKISEGYDDTRTNEALLQLESALALEKPPQRIECYDISTNHGSYTVASMVVFENGRSNKSQYRRFKIKTPLDEANDFLSMQEVMKRRFESERVSDKRFGSLPDLIILDGGKPQLSAVSEILDEMNVEGVELCGLAKRDEEIFTTWNDIGPVVLPSGSASLYLVKNIRDEAHRFAITYHRQLAKKGMTKSILDEVAGLGPKRKRKLLKYFGSFKNLKEATEQEIIDSKVLPIDVAKEVFIVLEQYSTTPR